MAYNDAWMKEGAAAYKAGQRGSDPNQTPGFDPGTFRQDYASKSGGNRPEDLASRFSDPTLAGWMPWYNPETGKYKSMRGAEGDFDKPTECPPGMVPSGPNEDDPCVDGSQAGAGGGGGGGGYGGGGGGGRGGGGSWDNPIYQYLKTTGLNAASSPDAALKAYMGYGGASQYQAQMDAARKQAEMLPPGPTRDRAMADLVKMKQSGLMGMRTEGMKAARGELTSALMPQEYGYSQLGENARQANMSNALGWGGLDLQRMLGLGNLNLAQGAQSFQQGPYFGWQQSESAADRALREKLANMDYQSQQPSTAQKWLGGAGTVLNTGMMALDAYGKIKAMSDIRLKEHITPSSKGLSALRKLPVYDYNYKGDPHPTTGVMAQDLEKVAPELVHETPIGKAVDLYGLLSLTMNSVKELDKKVSKRGVK